MKSNYRGQGTLIKVVSLAVGLTVGLVLIAKVHLEMNYDRCITARTSQTHRAVPSLRYADIYLR